MHTNLPHQLQYESIVSQDAVPWPGQSSYTQWEASLLNEKSLTLDQKPWAKISSYTFIAFSELKNNELLLSVKNIYPHLKDKEP